MRVAVTLSLVPHISTEARKLEQTTGRRGSPKIRQRLFSSSCTQRTPAGLPFDMLVESWLDMTVESWLAKSGMGDEIDGAMQHAPHPARQFIVPPRRIVAERIARPPISPAASRHAPDVTAQAMRHVQAKQRTHRSRRMSRDLALQIDAPALSTGRILHAARSSARSPPIL